MEVDLCAIGSTGGVPQLLTNSSGYMRYSNHERFRGMAPPVGFISAPRTEHVVQFMQFSSVQFSSVQFSSVQFN